MKSADIGSILGQLVEISSVTGNFDASHKIIDVTKSYLKSVPSLQFEQKTISNFPYLIATTQTPNTDMLWFVCHLDVVPAPESLFTVTEHSGKYYGRGVFDMKGMASSVIAAILEVKDPKHLNVGLMFTTDEEIGGKNGAGTLINADLKGSGAVVLDASSDWVLQEKMKGVLWLKVTASGKAAHGSRPWLGSNANASLIDYLSDFKSWFEHEIPQNAPENYFTTLNIGTIQGGEAVNQVSAGAEAMLDIRYTSKEEAERIISGARELAKSNDGIEIQVEMLEPNIDNDMSNFCFKKAKYILSEIGVKPGPNGERLGHGSTDGRFFAPYNIPVISLRPPGGEQHADGEWVSKEGLSLLKDFALRLMEETRSTP